MPRKLTFDKNAPRPKDIDVILPGLGVGSGRNRDRFRVSSETRVESVYRERQAMVRDLASRLLFALLRGRLEGRFSTTELHQAYKAGDAALRALSERANSQLLAPLIDQYKLINRSRDFRKTELQLQRFITWCGGPDKATTDALSSQRVAQFLRSLTSEGHRRGRLVSGATQNRYRAAIGGFATYLVREGILQRHPIAFRAVPKADEGEHRLPQLADDEYREYFDAVASYDAQLVVVFRILMHTGADLGEVLSRTVRDCELDRTQPRIRFRRSKTRTPERLVPFPQDFVAELRGHIAAHALRPGDRLFGMLLRSHVERTHQKARRQIGRPDLRIKDMRHLAAIAWRRADTELEAVREWLGHATINQTVIYNAFAPDDAYDAPKVDRAARILAGDGSVRALRPLRHTAEPVGEVAASA